MTWRMLASRIGVCTKNWMHVCNPVTSSSLPHDRPVSFQDMSRVGGPDLNSGAATHFGSLGSVMLNHPACHPFGDSTHEPSNQRTLAILPAIAPPHSAWVPDTTLGLTLKVLSQRPKWGGRGERPHTRR